jgi:transposase
VRDDAISVSLGLEGFAVLDTFEARDQVEVLIELKAGAGVCPGCAGASASVHERTDVRIRDIAVHAKPTYLLWRKRRFRCESTECDQSTFSEEHPEVPARARTTPRFRRHLATRAKRVAVSHVASEERTSWWLVWRSITEAVELTPADASAVHRLGIDEASFRRGLRFHTAFVDLDRPRLLDLVPGRTKRSVTDWVNAQPRKWRAGIAEVVIDPFDAYRQAVEEALPQVRLIVDKFHAVRLANRALDAVRRRLQREAGRRRSRHSRSVAPSRWGRALFHSRRVLVKARERLTSKERDRLERALDADPTGDLRQAWVLKERFRDWYLADSPEQARVRLRRWYRQVERSGILEFVDLARTVRAWEPGLLAHFDSGATNGPTEGITNLIKVVKRQGFGYRNFDNFRLRVLYRCG